MKGPSKCRTSRYAKVKNIFPTEHFIPEESLSLPIEAIKVVGLWHPVLHILPNFTREVMLVVTMTSLRWGWIKIWKWSQPTRLNPFETSRLSSRPGGIWHIDDPLKTSKLSPPIPLPFWNPLEVWAGSWYIPEAYRRRRSHVLGGSLVTRKNQLWEP